jgi:hypothetical protein
MDLKREHTIEMLLLIAAVAVVQLPAATPTSPDSQAAQPTQRSAAPVADLQIESQPAHRLDPIGLLQAGVPEDWRVALPDSTRAATPSNAC